MACEACGPADGYEDAGVECDERGLREQPDERRLDARPRPLEAEVCRGEARLDHAREMLKQAAELRSGGVAVGGAAVAVCSAVRGHASMHAGDGRWPRGIRR